MSLNYWVKIKIKKNLLNISTQSICTTWLYWAKKKSTVETLQPFKST